MTRRTAAVRHAAAVASAGPAPDIASRGGGSADAPRSRATVDPASVRRILREAGLHARHELSQNFLVDIDILEAVLAEAAPAPRRRILEIGPGLGILTEALLEAGAAVTAVELDRGIVRWLRSEHERALLAGARDPSEAGSLTLVQADALDLELTTLVAPPYDVVANLPYHVTSPILHRLLGGSPRPARLVLMVQREVAERIASPPGGLSYLSLFCQYHARVRVAAVVPASAFEPAPAVESAILVLEPWASGDEAAPPRLGPADEERLWRVVQAAFRERRKMLRNVLVRQLPVPADRVERALAEAGIEGARRPQTVRVEEWLRLVEALGPLGADTRGRRMPHRDVAARTSTDGLAGAAPDAALAGPGRPPEDGAADG